MQFALIDTNRVEPAPGLKGLCPGCGQPVYAKCGTQRIHHWAHMSKKPCDSWWEKETEWHRAWKNNFPKEWREFFFTDKQTGEKHIADVYTSHGLVIEFQHSSIKPQERTARERFYQIMVWVVDGTRLKYDYPRFLKAKNYFHSIARGVFRVNFPEECFPSAWLSSSVPVVWDFRGDQTIDDLDYERNDIYCLFPVPLGRDAVVAVVPRKVFIDAVCNGKWVDWVRNIMTTITQAHQELQHQIARQRQQQSNMTFERLSRTSQKRRRPL